MKKNRKSMLNRVAPDVTTETITEFKSEDDHTDFLIPTAQTQQQSHNQLIHFTGRKPSQFRTQKPLKQRLVSSSFYHLPIVHPSQSISINPYISFHAIFPSQPNTISTPGSTETPSSSTRHLDDRAVFLTNLPRFISSDSIAQLLAHPLHIPPSSIQVSIHHNPRFDNTLSSSQFNLYQRDVQIFNFILSKSNPKKNTKSNSNEDRDQTSNSINKKKQVIRLFDSKLKDETLIQRLWSKATVSAAHVRFETAEQKNELINMTELPMTWPLVDQENVSDGWMKIYDTRRKMSRLTTKRGTDYADWWMKAWETGQIPPLPKDEVDEPDVKEEEQHKDQESENDGAWTVVIRGGHHGRSTIPTQSDPPSLVPNRAPDPYAQSSMADRDKNAAVKVMEKTFTKKFHASDDHSLKRKSKNNLNPNFYKSDSSILNNNKKMRLNRIRDNFNQDKLKIQSNSK